MEQIFKLVSVMPVTQKDVQSAFDQKWKDFEDCVLAWGCWQVITKRDRL